MPAEPQAPAAPRREPAARRRARALAIAEGLRQRYPRVRIPLAHSNPLQLLVATILSAQCTDVTVNRVTPELFARYPDPQALAFAPRGELEAAIHPTGFFRQKARMIQETCRLLLEHHGGEVPRTLQELTRLPGVGRKTANVLLSAAVLEGWPGWQPQRDGLGLVVDTHVGRLSRRLALTFESDPERVEKDLQTLIPGEEWASFPLRIIYFGREVCTARRPACPDCPLEPLCPAGRHQGATPWLQGNRK